MANWVFPAASATIAAVFATMLLLRFLDTRKRHHLLWMLGLYGFSVAAAAQVVQDLNGAWPEGLYRVYYFLIGSLVATMGAGTMYLLNKRKVADLFLYAMIGLMAVQAILCAVTPVDTALLASAGTETGVRAASGPVRILTVILSIVGAGALIAGAVVSWFATKRPHNLVIVIGAALLTYGGGTAAIASSESSSAYALYFGNLAGISLLFFGFLMSRPAPDAAPKAAVATPDAPAS